MWFRIREEAWGWRKRYDKRFWWKNCQHGWLMAYLDKKEGESSRSHQSFDWLTKSMRMPLAEAAILGGPDWWALRSHVITLFMQPHGDGTRETCVDYKLWIIILRTTGGREEGGSISTGHGVHGGAGSSIFDRVVSGIGQEHLLSAGDRTVALHVQVENWEKEHNWGMDSRRLVL